MVNPNVVGPLIGVGASALVMLITGLFRAVVNGFREIKTHLNKQDTNITGISERVAKIEGSLEHRNSPPGGQ
jgi:hypothetical protein